MGKQRQKHKAVITCGILLMDIPVMGNQHKLANISSVWRLNAVYITHQE